LVFFFSRNVFASESAPESSDYGWFPSPLTGCKGKFYETPTQYNSISPKDQELWKIHDEMIDPENEYNALNIHACHVLSKGKSLKFLITKLEVHPDNKRVDRSLETFLSCLVTDPALFSSKIIYAWIPKADDKNLLGILRNSYRFEKSKIKLKDSNGNKIIKPQDTIQLQVSIGKLTMIEENTWLKAQLAS
jgi:hypothetical protein